MTWSQMLKFDSYHKSIKSYAIQCLSCSIGRIRAGVGDTCTIISLHLHITRFTKRPK